MCLKQSKNTMHMRNNFEPLIPEVRNLALLSFNVTKHIHPLEEKEERDCSKVTI